MYHVSAQGIDERMINVHYYNMTVRHNMNNTKYDRVSRQYDCVRHNMNRI